MKKIGEKGFTFLEVIIYIALTTIVIGVLFSFGWNMIGAKSKAATVRETLAGARFVNERLKREIRAAQEINRDQSVFGETPGKLVLTGEDGEITIESIGDKISIQRGSSDPQFLHSDRVRIRDFQLSEQVSTDGKTQYVGFSFTAEAYYPEASDRYEYKFSTPFRSGGEVRI
jgi:hypothetical protein